MSNRKQTPDVLGDILGGDPVPPQPPPAPKPKPKPAPKPPAKPRPRRPRSPQKWEYMEVVFRDYGGYRPRYINSEEQADWKKAPPMHEVLNLYGEQGWELVGVGARHKEEMPAFFKRPKKK